MDTSLILSLVSLALSLATLAVVAVDKHRAGRCRAIAELLDRRMREKAAARRSNASGLVRVDDFTVTPTADGRLFMTPAEVSALERVLPVGASNLRTPPGGSDS